uniref:TF-B3 domain-containing protein n=2 Tax=Zea mays TaxID=4577 RepID=A0A804MDF4_MAIZE
MPPVGAAVYYFPQGHAEQAGAAVDLRAAAGVPPFVLYSSPRSPLGAVADVGDALMSEGSRSARDGQQHQQPRPVSFTKVLTASDANNGDVFSVLANCAKAVFPELDYSLGTPKQFVCVRDVHGVEWMFCHIWRGSPKRHLLTAGWNNFVNTKKLRFGDSVVFMREEDSKIHVGLRRTNRLFGAMQGNGGGPAGAVVGPSDGKVSTEDVVAAARLAGAGLWFEVVYYPHVASSEFCVSVAAVKESMQVPWFPGLQL